MSADLAPLATGIVIGFLIAVALTAVAVVLIARLRFTRDAGGARR